MTAYLDASVLLPTLIEEPGSVTVDQFISTIDDDLVISELAAAEVASGLSRLVRTRALEQTDALARLADFDAWRTASSSDLDLQSSDIRLANLFVRRFDLMLRAPDALHAAICRRAGYLLVTMDRRLAAAAEELGVHTQLLQQTPAPDHKKPSRSET